MGCGGELNLKFSKVCEGWRMISDKICEKIGFGFKVKYKYMIPLK